MVVCPEVYELPPIWLPFLTNALLLLTVPSCFYTLYLIAIVTPPHTDRLYKIYLICYHVVASGYSILNALLGVVQYTPALLVIQLGMIGGNSMFLFLFNVKIQATVVTLGLVVLTHRFSIILYGDQKKMIFQVIFVAICTFFVIAPALVVFYFTLMYDAHAAGKQLVEDCPHLMPLTISYKVLYVSDPVWVHSLMYDLLLFTFLVSFIFFILLSFCLIQFQEKTQHFSKTTRKLYIRLMINLACTIMIPILMHGLPTAGLEILMLSQLQAMFPTVVWSLGSAHALMNCATFIGLNEFYLKKFKSDFRFCLSSFVTKNIPSSLKDSQQQPQEENFDGSSNGKGLGCSRCYEKKFYDSA